MTSLPRCLAINFICVIAIGTMFLVCMLTDVQKMAVSTRVQNTKAGATFLLEDSRSIIRAKLNKTRLLCWVTTMLKNLQQKTKFVKMTWGPRCDVLLFFGSEGDANFPVIKLNVSEGRKHLASKTQAALHYIYENYRDRADWFLKADDDTYVLVDNLKHFLSDYNTSRGLYFGFTFIGQTPQGYNSGGGGYVLSQDALRSFYQTRSSNKTCKVTISTEDVYVGKCMHTLGVKNINTLDEKNRTRFHAYHPLTHIDLTDPYLKRLSSYGPRTGAHNISSLPFTFHYVSGRDMRLLEFLIYHIRHLGDGGTMLP